MYILRGVLQWLQSPALNSKGAPRALVRHMPGAPGTGELLNGVTRGQPKIPGSKKVILCLDISIHKFNVKMILQYTQGVSLKIQKQAQVARSAIVKTAGHRFRSPSRLITRLLSQPAWLVLGRPGPKAFERPAGAFIAAD